jgi:predicted DNA-binding WGR domain protein
MTRTFEFIAGNSAKFWQVTVQGCACTVCFGKLGTQGQSQTKTFADTLTAQRHAETLITQKLRKGYSEVVTA